VLAVKRSCGTKLFLAGALVLTLAVKLFAYRHESVSTDPEVLTRAVSSFLLRHGFESHVEKRFGIVFIHANAGECRVLIREAVPQGWDHSSIEMGAKSVGRLSYVFDGTVYTREPFVAPMLQEYWTRARFKMGLSPNRHPLLAVAASNDCTIDTLPWWELAVQS
jgi:hypothetical protein